MQEIWKDIKEYEGKYQISNFGRVKSLVFSNRQVTFNREKILKPSNFGRSGEKGDGYWKISLSKNGSKKQFFIHRLVAEAFIPNPNNYPFVNHKDENRLNNDMSNLEWCTNEYNAKYGTRGERMKGTNSIKIETPFEGDDKVYYINGGRTSGKVNKLVDNMIKLINDLKQENQQLKLQISAREEVIKRHEDNWNKLKEYAKDNLYFYSGYQGEDLETDIAIQGVLNKMQELERGDSNVED